jgi:hypothetical protein
MTPDLRRLRKELRSYTAGNVAEYKRLRVAFQRHMRCRKRIWLQHRARTVLSSLKHDSHGVYARLAGKSRKSIPKLLRDPGHWHAFISNLASPAAAPNPPPLPTLEDTSALCQAAEHLNVPFASAEVASGLSRLNNHRTAGLSGFCAEFFRYATYQPPPVDGELPPAEHVLLQPLTVLMNAVFKQGVVPAEWDLSLITPVHKRGTMLDTSNYRPIAVGEPLARLYAVLLQQRLDAHLEEQGLRSDSQAGFRKGLSTNHQLFVVQHFIDKCCHEKKALYACWVDLKSAYDFVVRHVLWSCMGRKGIHGPFLAAVKSLYATPRYAVCIDGRVGSAAQSMIGVRQGCPLSPLLFGIMLDDLSAALLTAVHHAPCLDACYDSMEEPSTGHIQRYTTRPVTNLDFADDVILLSTSRQGMQGLLRELQFFCVQRGMIVNAPKTHVIQLAPGSTASPESYDVPLMLNGQVLQVEACGAKYLGLFVAPRTGVRAACIDLQQRSHNAWMAFNRRKHDLLCEPSIPILLRLYTSVVRPVMLYGSEVWALLPGGKTARRRLFAADHKHLASLAGVPVGTSAETLHLALSVLPLEWEVQLRAVRFWENMWALPSSHLFRHVAFDNWRACCAGSKNFAYGLLAFLNTLAPNQSPHALTTLTLRGVPRVPASNVLQCLLRLRQSRFDVLASIDPVVAPSPRVVLCTYLRYHALLEHADLVLLYHLPLSLKACRILLRFMLGVSSLPLHAGRHSPYVPRPQRSCTLCTTACIADEFHMMFVCPALRHLRTGTVFEDLQRRNCCTVVDFMRHPARFGVAGFLLRALRAYDAAVRLC